MSLDPSEFLPDIISRAKKRGADTVEVVFSESTSLSYRCRLGVTESLERSESRDLGLRLIRQNRQVCLSTSELSPETLSKTMHALVERAGTMLEAVPEDPYCTVATPEQCYRDEGMDLDLFDPHEPDVDALMARAMEAESAARENPAITNSEGAEASWGRDVMTLMSSNGFHASRTHSGSSFGVAVLAGSGTAMEQDYDYASATHVEDLPAPADMGRAAAARAVARLNPRKVSSAAVPIVYDARIAGSILSHLSGAVNGARVARGASFLKDDMGAALFDSAITITDDPHRVRGLRSSTFDGEGLATQKRNLIDAGVLTSWVTNLRAATQMGLASSSHGVRHMGVPPSIGVHNLHLHPGPLSIDALIGDIKQGFLVSEMMGASVNMITGDYSRGASGFWIENGAIAYPVNEVTIAGNLKEMFRALVPANDLTFRFGVDAPSIRIDGMTVAGK